MTLSTDKIFTLLYSLCNFIDYIPFPDFVKKEPSNRCITFSKLYRSETEAISHQCKQKCRGGT